jgi:hypothetical protein
MVPGAASRGFVVPIVLGVVLLRRRFVEFAQLQRHDLEVLPLDAADDLANKVALYTIGLAKDERAILRICGSHKRQMLRPATNSS